MILEKWKWRGKGKTQELKSALKSESEQGKQSMHHAEWVVGAKMKFEVLIHIRVRGKHGFSFLAYDQGSLKRWRFLFAHEPSFHDKILKHVC